MAADWWCCNCGQKVELTRHGRCSTCDSDSVAVADINKAFVRNEIAELERLFEFSPPERERFR